MLFPTRRYAERPCVPVEGGHIAWQTRVWWKEETMQAKDGGREAGHEARGTGYERRQREGEGGSGERGNRERERKTDRGRDRDRDIDRDRETETDR